MDPGFRWDGSWKVDAFCLSLSYTLSS